MSVELGDAHLERIGRLVVVEEEVDQQVAKAFAVGVAGVVGQSAPGPGRGLRGAVGGHQCQGDLLVLLGALQVLGEDCDVVVNVAGEFSELFAEVADGELSAPGVRCGTGGAGLDLGGDVGDSFLAEGWGEGAQVDAGQPGPSNCAATSHEARVFGLAGGASSRARAYRSVSSCSASPTMPEESSRYISVRVTRSTAVRSVRTTVWAW